MNSKLIIFFFLLTCSALGQDKNEWVSWTDKKSPAGVGVDTKDILIDAIWKPLQRKHFAEGTPTVLIKNLYEYVDKGFEFHVSSYITNGNEFICPLLPFNERLFARNPDKGHIQTILVGAKKNKKNEWQLFFPDNIKSYGEDFVKILKTSAQSQKKHFELLAEEYGKSKDERNHINLDNFEDLTEEIKGLSGERKIWRTRDLRNLQFEKFLIKSKIPKNSFEELWRFGKGKVFDDTKEYDVLNLPKLNREDPLLFISSFFYAKYYSNTEHYNSFFDPLYRPLIVEEKADYKSKTHGMKVKFYASLEFQTPHCTYLYLIHSVLKTYDSALRPGKISKKIYANAFLLRKEKGTKNWFLSGDTIGTPWILAKNNFMPTHYKQVFLRQLNKKDRYLEKIDALLKAAKNNIYKGLLKRFRDESTYLE